MLWPANNKAWLWFISEHTQVALTLAPYCHVFQITMQIGLVENATVVPEKLNTVSRIPLTSILYKLLLHPIVSEKYYLVSIFFLYFLFAPLSHPKLSLKQECFSKFHDWSNLNWLERIIKITAVVRGMINEAVILNKIKNTMLFFQYLV